MAPLGELENVAFSLKGLTFVCQIIPHTNQLQLGKKQYGLVHGTKKSLLILSSVKTVLQLPSKSR